MTNEKHTTENVTLHFKVSDYATWRSGYDGNEKNRAAAGITNGRVFRRAEDPNDVVILRTSPMSPRPAPGSARTT